MTSSAPRRAVTPCEIFVPVPRHKGRVQRGIRPSAGWKQRPSGVSSSQGHQVAGVAFPARPGRRAWTSRGRAEPCGQVGLRDARWPRGSRSGPCRHLRRVAAGRSRSLLLLLRRPRPRPAPPPPRPVFMPWTVVVTLKLRFTFSGTFISGSFMTLGECAKFLIRLPRQPEAAAAPQSLHGLSALQHNKPLYSFEDNADYVYDVMWSPVHPALFACVDGMGRLDLWNLNNDTEVSGAQAPGPPSGEGAPAAVCSPPAAAPARGSPASAWLPAGSAGRARPGVAALRCVPDGDHLGRSHPHTPP